LPSTAAEAIKNTYAWFEVNSGWAQPTTRNLAEWVADGVCRCPANASSRPTACASTASRRWWLIVQDLPRLLGHMR